MNNHPKVIIFDAFGTLVKIGESRTPYRKLMKWLRENGRKPMAGDASIIMSNAVDVEQLAKKFGYVIPVELLNEINNDLQCEFNTIELYEDTISTLQSLKEQDFKIALCSNLAMPYGEKLKTKLASLFDFIAMSYEIGYIKPEQQIYDTIRAYFNCRMSDMLFIGDHPILDVEKPISLGMSARLIKRGDLELLTDILEDLLPNNPSLLSEPESNITKI